MRHDTLLGIVLAMVSASAAADTVLVSDEQAHVIHVLDGSTGKVTGRIDVGRRPRGIGLSPDGRTLYVAAGDDDRIDVVDVASRRRTGSLPSGPDPERFAVSPDGRRLYVANERDSAVSFVDVASRTIVQTVEVGGEPEGMAVSPDGRTVACTSEAASLVHLIDTRTGQVTDNLLVGTRPRDAAFTHDGRWLLVTSEMRGTVAVFDASRHTLDHTIDFYRAPGASASAQAVGLALAPEGQLAYVALGRGNQAAEVDIRSGRIQRYFAVGNRSWGIAVSVDGKRVYAAAGLSGDLTIIDRATGATTTVALGGRPWGVVALR
jgi:PQQ-dependent catabolism-associated beta-propeller protein